MSKLQRGIALFLLLSTYHVMAADITVNDDVVPRGWNQAVSNSIPIYFKFSNPAGYIGSVDAVITRKSGGWGISPSDFEGLPIELKDSSNGHTGFFLTVVGDLRLKVWGKDVSSSNPRPEPGEWKVSDFRNSATQKDGYDFLYRWMPTIPAGLLGWGGYLSGNVKAVLYCEPYVGDVCVIPSKPLQIPELNLRLYTSSISLREPINISRAGGLMGTISFSRPCMFNVTNKRFSEIELPRLGKRGLHSRIDTTNVSINCPQGTGKGSDADKLGNVKMRLTPTHGEVTPGIAATSGDGLGIVFKLGQNKPKSCDGNHNFGVFELKPLSVQGISKKETDPVHKETQINWGYCQYKPDASAGEFQTTINYEMWLY